MCSALIAARVMITHHREVKRHRTLGNINICSPMNARNLGMSKMKCLIPNSRGNTAAGFFAETQGSGDLTNEFHFAVLKDGGC